ncbi:MAG: PQQ-binding-like beta-propeller repeat protein [Polyangia bacterium]
MNRALRLVAGLAFASALATGATGCAQVAAFRKPFEAPGNALRVSWRRQITETQLYGGHDTYIVDGKAFKAKTGLVMGYKPQEFAAAISDGTRVFVGSAHGMMWALSAADGSLLWRRPLAGPISSEPAYFPEIDLLVVGDDNGALWGLDPATGQERWVYRVHSPITAQPVYAEGLIYFTTTEDRIYAVDASRGTWKWQYDREAPEGFTIRGQGGPLYTKGRIYVGFADGFLASLEARTGDVVWVKSLAGETTSHYVDVDSTPILVDGTLYASSVSGGVFALDPKDGSVHWRFEADGASSIRVHDERVYFSAGRQGLHCLDLAGRLVWRQELAGAGELSTPLVVDDTHGKAWVVLSAAAAGAYIADAQTGVLSQFLEPGDGVSAPASTDGKNVYVVSNGGFVWALSIGNRPREAARNQMPTIEGL